jgi:hypothetical protein
MKKKVPTRADLEYLAWKAADKEAAGKIVLSKDKEENRRRYPELAKIIDEVRRLWPDAKIKISPQSQATRAQDGRDD